MSEIRFYIDESVELAVSEQLAASGIDVVSAHSLGTLGDKDPTHLQRATRMGRVLRTYDTDFLRLISQQTDHAGWFLLPSARPHWRLGASCGYCTPGGVRRM